MKKLWRLPEGLVLVVPFVLLSPVLLRGQAMFWGVPSLQFIPWWAQAWETVLSGHLPLWNPLVGMGAPLLANYQTGLLYPPNWLYFPLYGLGGTPWMAWGMALLVAVHLAWAGLGMARLIRRLGLPPLAQTVSGLAFGMGGYMVARSGFLSINAAVAWLPWILLGVLNVVTLNVETLNIGTSKGWKLQTVWLGVFIGMQLLAGHAQTSWYTMLLAVAMGSFWAWQKGRQDGDSRSQILLRAWGRMGLAVVIGLALAAIQLLPTVEYLLNSQRSGSVDVEVFATYSFSPWRFLSMLAPDLYGNPVRGDYAGYGNYWEDDIYLGLLPLLLAGMMILGRGKTKARKNLVRFLVVLMGVSFLLALGKNTPVFLWLFEHVPTFDMFNSPTRFSLWAVFALALLAGYGAARWRRPEGRALYWSRLGTMGAFAIMVGAGLGWVVLGDASPAAVRAMAIAGFWALGAGVLNLLAPPKEGRTSARPYNRNLWVLGVALWVAVDVLAAGWGLNPGYDLSLYGESSPVVGQVETILNETGGSRLYLPAEDEYTLKFDRYFTFEDFSPEGGWEEYRGSLLPNLTLLDGLASANNFDPLSPGRYAAWKEALDDENKELLWPRMLALMSVGAVQRVDEDAPYAVSFEAVETLPRLRWVACVRPAQDEEDAFAQVMAWAGAGEELARNEVILEGDGLGTELECSPGGEGKVELVDENPNRLVIMVSSDTPGWLVVGDVWYPGWRVWVDGEVALVQKADYLFRAVYVPAGEVEVVMVYQPWTFYLGALVSAAAWVGVVGMEARRRRLAG